MANISNKGPITDMSTVVKIAVDGTCPPYTHKIESLCFTVPTMMVPGADTGCTCALEMSMAYMHVMKLSHEMEDQRIKKYGRLMKAALHLVDHELYSDLMLIVKFHGEKIVINYNYLPSDSTQRSIELCYVNENKISARCPYGFITCKDKTCIVETSRCDGIIDCVDGDDEVNCSHICTHPHLVTMCTRCNIADGYRCHSLYYQCSTGGCFSATAICDGLVSCTDGSDELMCTPQLPPMH